MPNDCQIEPAQHVRAVPQQSGVSSTPMGINVVVGDVRHLNQLASDQEPPEIDETDPDVIPNQYGKSISTPIFAQNYYKAHL